MIIFYNKKTKEIIGVINGRVHDKHTLEKTWVGDKKETERYIVPLKPKVKKGKVTELIPDEPCGSLILKFESGEENIYNYNIKSDSKKKVVGFEKKQ